MSKSRKLSMVYNPALYIQDKSLLSSLAVFYDHIYLPSELARQAKGLVIVNGGYQGAWYVQEIHWEAAPTDSAFDDNLRQWERDNQTLFRNDVLSRLEPPSLEVIDKGKKNLVRLVDHLNRVNSFPNPQNDPYYRSLSKYLGSDLNSIHEPSIVYMDRYVHQLREDVIHPSVFHVPHNSSRREAYKFLLNHNVVKYLIPQLVALEPEEILEIRADTAEHREGYSMYLQELSSEVESRVTAGEGSSQLDVYARNIVETKIIPMYREYVRVLRATKKGRKGKLLDISGRLIEIDAPIGSPKSLAQLLRVFGLAFETDSKELERQLSNKNQAYQFMRLVEDYGKNIG